MSTTLTMDEFALTYEEALGVLEVSHEASSSELHLNHTILQKLASEIREPDKKQKRQKLLDAALKTVVSVRIKMTGHMRNSSNSCCYSFDDSEDEMMNPMLQSAMIHSHWVAGVNAAELIREEEKQKSEKQKSRKKKKNVKKKETHKDNNEETNENDITSEKLHNVDCEEEDLDLNSAFIIKMIPKEERLQHEQEQDKDQNRKNELLKVLKSLTEQGEKCVEQDNLVDAAQVYTEAIKLHPNKFAFYGNRSYCYERLGKYELALNDANKALQLQPKCSVSHYRKGCALLGLKDYVAAEESFITVQKLDKTCVEAKEELIKTRKLRLMEMGFSESQSEKASRRYRSIEEAVNAFTRDTNNDDYDSMSDVFVSDDEGGFFNVIRRVANSEEINPHNPQGLKALWVGELDLQVTELHLKECFSKYGEVTEVTIKPTVGKQFAFINYADKASAGKAMCALQGYPLCGRPMLVKLPLKRLGAGESTAKTMTRQIGMFCPRVKDAPKMTTKEHPLPINGNECYFWRKRGYCTNGNNCNYRHVKSNKGIDGQTRA